MVSTWSLALKSRNLLIFRVCYFMTLQTTMPTDQQLVSSSKWHHVTKNKQSPSVCLKSCSISTFSNWIAVRFCIGPSIQYHITFLINNYYKYSGLWLLHLWWVSYCTDGSKFIHIPVRNNMVSSFLFSALSQP